MQEFVQSRLSDESQRRRASADHRRSGWFIKGPLPLNWLRRACRLPGKAPLVVALAIWFRAGVERTDSPEVSTRWPMYLGLSCRSAHRGMRMLESVGLVKVNRRKGRPPVVSIVNDDQQEVKR